MKHHIRMISYIHHDIKTMDVCHSYSEMMICFISKWYSLLFVHPQTSHNDCARWSFSRLYSFRSLFNLYFLIYFDANTYQNEKYQLIYLFLLTDKHVLYLIYSWKILKTKISSLKAKILIYYFWSCQFLIKPIFYSSVSNF